MRSSLDSAAQQQAKFATNTEDGEHAPFRVNAMGERSPCVQP